MQTRRIERNAMTAVGSVLAVLMLAAPGFAVDIVDDPVQIDERAAQVVYASNALCWEIYRYHQQKPDYPQMYRKSKEVWSQAGELRDALRAGPIETEVLMQKMSQLNEVFSQVEIGVAKWGDGDRSLAPDGRGPRTVVTPGVAVDIPFVGVRVGGPRYVVTDDGLPPIQRRRLHPNSRGSKRSLERELAAAKVAVGYLMEDVGATNETIAPPPGAATAPVPQPPEADPVLSAPQKIVPPSAKK